MMHFNTVTVKENGWRTLDVFYLLNIFVNIFKKSKTVLFKFVKMYKAYKPYISFTT